MTRVASSASPCSNSAYAKNPMLYDQFRRVPCAREFDCLPQIGDRCPKIAAIRLAHPAPRQQEREVEDVRAGGPARPPG